MYLKLLTILLLLIRFSSSVSTAQGPVHTKLRIRTEENNNFHPVTVLGDRIHLWQVDGSDIRIHIFDKRLNVVKHGRFQREKGLLQNIVFASFDNFYYAFVFTKIRNYLSIQLLKIDDEGAVSVRELPETVPARVNRVNEIHVEKDGDDVLLFRRIPAGQGFDKSILVHRLDSSLRILNHQRVFTPIANSLDLSWKISDNGVIYFAGTCVNKNVENVLVVERVDLSQQLTTRYEYPCGNNEFSSLNLFDNDDKGLLKIFCVEDRKRENIVNNPNLFVSIFTINEELNSEIKPENVQFSNTSGENVPQDSKPAFKLPGTLTAESGYIKSGSRENNYFKNPSYGLGGQVYEYPSNGNQFLENTLVNKNLVPKNWSDDLQSTIDGPGKFVQHLELPDSPDYETSYYKQKLIIGSNGMFRLYFNEPAIKERSIIKCIEIEKDQPYREKLVVANPRYYYLLNLSIKLDDGRYLVPYTKGDLYGLSIHSF